MRLLMRVNYNDLLFPAGVNITEILKAAEGMKLVNKDYHGIITINGDAAITFELISDDSVMLPDTPHSSDYDQFHTIASERDKLEREVRDLKAKLKKFEEAAKEA